MAADAGLVAAPCGGHEAAVLQLGEGGGPGQTVSRPYVVRVDLDEAVAVVVLGERGRWLAARNRQWRSLGKVAEDPETVWRTGPAVERLDLLRGLRASNPQAARALLESIWSEKESNASSRFLVEVREKLNSDDEPFLEAAL